MQNQNKFRVSSPKIDNLEVNSERKSHVWNLSYGWSNKFVIKLHIINPQMRKNELQFLRSFDAKLKKIVGKQEWNPFKIWIERID